MLLHINRTHSQHTNSFLLLRRPPKQSTMFTNFSTLWKTINEPVQDNGKEMRVVTGPTTKSSHRLHASLYPSHPARLIAGENDPLALSKVSINDRPSSMTCWQFLEIPKPMGFGIETNTSIPNPLMPRPDPPEKLMELDNATARPVSGLPLTTGLPENLMEPDNVTTGPGPPVDPNTIPKPLLYHFRNQQYTLSRLRPLGQFRPGLRSWRSLASQPVHLYQIHSCLAPATHPKSWWSLRSPTLFLKSQLYHFRNQQ